MKLKMMLTVTVAMAAFAAVAQDKQVTIASWGGSYQESQSKALFEPAEAKTGIKVTQETYGGMSDVRLQVQTGKVTLDIVASGSGSAARAGAEGLLEELDYNVIDVSTFYPHLYTKYCVGGDVFSTVYAWNTNTYGDNGPQSWADFWDTDKFPGKRAYRGKVAGALEPALMADGVAPEDVYKVLDSEEGIKRAIDKIRQLKPHIDVFWTSGAQHAQLMKDGEVDMTTGWNGRFDNAAKDGAKVKYSFNQALLDYDCFAIPKGAPNKDTAMAFLAEISKPEYQDDLPKYITYGPTNKAAYETGEIDAATAAGLPSSPANAAMQLPVSLDWYAKWETKAAEMYQEMLTE
ncbi:MAG: polyamine ABC transporter substrate-binding protein [Rhodobiaceae bacterium]|nr:polyamine ABC transporter substrate-binding protein [Rhodobiaceae bacterium]MCC0014861.1 polyamine ABC transporter substrate-binding protein [Rhodobiaceae bacterium]MCC0042584.1 polyamine ABC transporter substrate-binding protein [Rhodobiaceae bacterium]MCC0051302.1 polyamine ABC transporter substrate-binding protein [Rhodobiaceae bacterium]MCC0053133.1 polyamine ABC transporter substrate-binding protein [Rhodobiaceae bacterium]